MALVMFFLVTGNTSFRCVWLSYYRLRTENQGTEAKKDQQGKDGGELTEDSPLPQSQRSSYHSHPKTPRTQSNHNAIQ